MSSEQGQSAKFTPGSNSAIQVGCTCARIDNHYGMGALINGERKFVHSGDCPLHGDKSHRTIYPSVVCPDDMQTRGG